MTRQAPVIQQDAEKVREAFLKKQARGMRPDEIEPPSPAGAATISPRAAVASVELIRAADVKPVAVSWLWPGWLARGKFHLLAGAPGAGKTTIALAFAACVSARLPWPSGWRSKAAGNVLFWSGEDDVQDTLVPRLIAAGADLDRVQFLGDRVSAEGARRPFDLATDIPILTEAARSVRGGFSLIVVDPVVTAVTGDSHKNTDVRRALQPLVDLAARQKAAVVGVSHLSKGTVGRDPLERVTGSIAFGALARVVLVAAKRSKGESGAERLLARVKSNIGPDGGGFGYSLDQSDNGITVSSLVRWGAAQQGSARDLLGEFEDDPEDQDGEADGACEWLAELLADGELLVRDVKQSADAAGYAWRTVQRKARSMKLTARREGFGPSARYFWSLPKGASDSA
jgi:hypothetical protein